MLIALPNLDGNFTCTLFLAYEDGQEQFEKLKTNEEITTFFTKYFPDAMNMMPDLIQQFNANPIGNLCTMKCDPWHYED
jgi:kynurenine 3-monooxygenase